MQKKRRDQCVFQYRFRLGRFHADARLAKALDHQPGFDDELYPPAQRAVKPGNPERLRLLAFLLGCLFKPEGIDPPIGGIENNFGQERVLVIMSGRCAATVT